MDITLSSFISASISLTIFIWILLFITRNKKVTPRFGLGCIYLLILLILLRGFIPIEFHAIKLTYSLYSETLYAINKVMTAKLFDLGSFSVTAMRIIYFVWIVGSIIFLGHLLLGYRKDLRILSQLNPVTDEKTLEIFDSAYKQMYPGKTNHVRLVSSDLLLSPAIWGLRRPIIFLPHIQYTEEELHYVFTHELLHHKHRDFLIKILLEILSAIHWWNPLVSRFLFPVINQTQEMNVDYDLTRNLDQAQVETYLLMLQKTAIYQRTHKALKNTYALADNHKSEAFIQRVKYIIDQPAKRYPLSGVILCVFLFIASFTFVFEPIHFSKYDEEGHRVYRDDGENTYYIKNGNQYDLYMENEYLCTTDHLFETFKDAPIYSSKSEVPNLNDSFWHKLLLRLQLNCS